MELLRKISSKFMCIGSNPLKNAEVFYIGGSDTLPPPLKKDEEEALMKKLANGDMSVKATLIERNLRLVVYIARKFENTGIYVEDLISIGTIGLIKAINTFNPLKNIKLATYARLSSAAGTPWAAGWWCHPDSWWCRGYSCGWQPAAAG